MMMLRVVDRFWELCAASAMQTTLVFCERVDVNIGVSDGLLDAFFLIIVLGIDC